MTALAVMLRRSLMLVVAISYATFLVWQEWDFRANVSITSPFVASTLPAPSRETLDTTAITTVLGLADETARLPSAEPLTLQASFVVGSGVSRALLADSQGSRMYQVGEQLPGGSVLRRVEPNQVVLWNKGREELLTLQPSAERFLRRLEWPAAPNAAAVSSRFLRPFFEPSE